MRAKRLVLSLGAVALLALAQNIELPPMKEGLWAIHHITIQSPSGKKMESIDRLCRNHEYDAFIRAEAKKAPGCKILHESLKGAVYTSETECTALGTVIHAKSTVTTGDNAVRSESHAVNTPPLNGVTENTIIMEQKYVGACPADLRPGDLVRADGIKINAWKAGKK